MGMMLKGLWVGTQYAATSAQNAARQQEAIQRAKEHQARREALLGQNTPLSGFADHCELARYRYQEDSIYLGRVHENHGLDIGSVGITDPRGFVVLAGSRSGKGRSLSVQNAIRWPFPLLMIDPKGEAASITAMRRGTRERALGTGTSVRRFLDQQVAILDPLHITEGAARTYKINYNPLRDVNIRDRKYGRQIRDIVRSIIIPDVGGAGEHFAGTTAILLRGMIEAVLIRELDPKRRTIPFVRHKLLFDPYNDVLEYLKNSPLTPAGFARQAFKIIDDVGADEWGSTSSTMSRNMEWLGDPDMLDHLGHSDFSLRQAVQEGWSIFIVLPADSMDDFKAWMRIVVQVAINAKVALGANQTGPQTLFMLDEFPLLGHFKSIEKSAGFMAGYGIKLVPIIQNLTQVIESYPKNWEAFFANAAATVAFGMSEKTDKEYVSEMLGKILVWEESYGCSDGISFNDQIGAAGGAQSGWNVNLSQRERPVRYANEISHQSAPDEMLAFVMPNSKKPFMVRRQNYDALGITGLFDSPAHIREWERRYRDMLC